MIDQNQSKSAKCNFLHFKIMVLFLNSNSSTRILKKSQGGKFLDYLNGCISVWWDCHIYNLAFLMMMMMMMMMMIIIIIIIINIFIIIIIITVHHKQFWTVLRVYNLFCRLSHPFPFKYVSVIFFCQTLAADVIETSLLNDSNIASSIFGLSQNK